MKAFIETIIGLAVWGLLAFGVYHFLFRADGTDEPVSEISAEVTTRDLEFFASQPKENRDRITAYLIDSEGADPADMEHYVDCMGDFAVNKLQTLQVAEIFDWCVTESQENRERFTTHFNELEDTTLPRHAVAACENFIKARLMAPASAQFHDTGVRYVDHGGGRYTIRSYVDAQNAYGAMLRTNFTCYTRFSGNGDPWQPEAWLPLSVELEN